MPEITPVTLGSFARELVLQLEPLPNLLASWSMTAEDYERLRKSEFFQKELVQAVAEVKAMGPDAGFITRAKILSEDFLPKIVGLMEAPTTAPEIKVAIFKHMTELARLQAPKNVAAAPTGPQGPAVTFIFGNGMPGMPQTVTLVPEPKVLENQAHE